MIGFVVFIIGFICWGVKEYIRLGKKLKRAKPRYTKKEHKELEKIAAEIAAEGKEILKKYIMKTKHLSLYGTRVFISKLGAKKKVNI